VFEFLQSGGPLMIPIGLCSVVGMAAFLERLWALRQGRVLPRSLRVAVMDLVRQGRFEDALIACRQSESPLGPRGRGGAAGSGACARGREGAR
jgi:biopolymer transport protein ExbB